MSAGQLGRVPSVGTDKAWDGSVREGTYKEPEERYNITVSKSILKEKIKQFKLGKYTDKYIRTYLEFMLMEGIVDNLEYLEHLKDIGTNV